MATRENLPKIVTDIQDTVTQLSEEFENSREPITDDSTSLHRLCAKLEFLLTSSLKEKAFLGSKRSYWHWMYACLRHARGLNEGLRYVQANKELRTSRGRGRALIRYCLVHQTLADSLQNCAMNKSVCNQHLNSQSVLNDATYTSVLVTSLYDLNAVNFDLNAKGYDLDTGWPTFASKCNPTAGDQWAIQSHVGSLGSLTSASVVMDTPRLHGSGNNAPSSVDQRIEDLVLELDQSDVKIQEQQQAILQLELKAESLEKCTGEKEDILARVISDLETKNRHLHDAMSHMTSEFQAREQQWSEKTENLTKTKKDLETKTSAMTSKIEQLEEDKRNLEELVSQKMSRITENFGSPDFGVSEAEQCVTTNHCQSGDTTADLAAKLKKENDSLKNDLTEVQRTCEDLESKLKQNNLSEARVIEMQALLEQYEENTDILVSKAKAEATDASLKELLQRISEAASISDSFLYLPTSEQVDFVLSELTALRRESNLESDSFQTSSSRTRKYSSDAQMNSLKDENDLLTMDRDSALIEVGQVRQKWNKLQLDIDNAKLQLESVRNESSSRISELEEQLSLKIEQVTTLQRQHVEMLTDLGEAQDSLKHSEAETEAANKKYKDLEQELKRKESSWNERLEEERTELEEEICSNEFVISELQNEVNHHSSLSGTLDVELEREKVKCANLRSDLEIANNARAAVAPKIADADAKLKLMQETLETSQNEMKRLEEEHEASMAAVLRRCQDNRERDEKMMSEFCDEFRVSLSAIKRDENTPEVQMQDVILDQSPYDDGNDVAATDDLLSSSRKIGREMLETINKLREEVTIKEKELSDLRDESDCYKTKAKEEIVEHQSIIGQREIEVATLRNKMETYQEEKLQNLQLIEELQQEVVDLKVALESSNVELDQLKLKLMEGSTREVELHENIHSRDEDIASLKEKITDLLIDKDQLWKDREHLRTRADELEDNLDEANWVHDEDVTKCALCRQTFSVTNRKHHCRICGQIYCKVCSENWLVRNGKKIRVCKTCVADSNVGALNSSTSSNMSSTYTTPSAKNADAILSGSYEEIDSTEVKNIPSTSSAAEPERSSIYRSLTDIISSSVSTTPSKERKDVKSEDTLTIAARKEAHLPVLIEQEGLTLRWNISSDRDINFRLFFSPSEEADEQDLVPVRRVDSHLEDFTGHLVARQIGIYTIVLDNSFSRMTSKSVTYKLEIV